MKSVLCDGHFHKEQAAYTFVEARVWPNGPVCPHCGGADRISKMQGKSTRIGAYKCYQCRKPFTVKIGTIFESSHVPLRHWLQAIFLLSSSKKGISSNQLARTLGCTLKTAWFLSHRIREAMRGVGLPPLGGAGKIIESDETYWGPKDVDTNPKMRARRRGKPGPGGKARIMTLVERGGQARSVKVADLTNETMQRILLENADRNSRLMTDEGTAPSIGLLFAKHETVKHSAREYARGDVTTNTVEGYFSVFKRGMRGTYQHCAEKHLERYLAEFDFRYNNRVALGVNDVQRAERALKGVVGKRLTYQTAH
ncbi:MAG TPA: IS1595 family transposase [Pseudolabrys sp.]|jgi:transposase-like protein|nr:IS1595 family transposase [Pseudolabrys sp.]